MRLTFEPSFDGIVRPNPQTSHFKRLLFRQTISQIICNIEPELNFLRFPLFYSIKNFFMPQNNPELSGITTKVNVVKNCEESLRTKTASDHLFRKQGVTFNRICLIQVLLSIQCILKSFCPQNC